jgi:small-conductance mechanosensitive channel
MTPSIMIVIAILIWVVGRIAAVAPEGQRWASAAGITQSTVILLPIVAGGVATLVREHFALHTLRDTRHPLTIALGTIATSFASGAIWIIGLGLLAQIWGVFLIGSESMLVGTGLRIVLTVTIVGIIAWTALTLLRAVFDAYTPKEVTGMPGEGDDAEPTVQSRLSTVLPLIRGIVLGFVIGITVLVGLSMLGVDISPLLAGAGILGLAISFGSQALVRDIVSGIFFMADDAFRAGEYVDTGRLKGTVEKITLRSIRLRHQSGQIHTIPFGQLQSITNFSRDWATMKFNIRLDPDADIERARKLAKKVGAAMQADPELGPEIILPLKMQGVSEIDIAAVVVRFKITCKPARSSWVQREALKRLFAAYNAEGIPFASNAVTVRGGDAAAGAAASASATSHAVPG